MSDHWFSYMLDTPYERGLPLINLQLSGHQRPQRIPGRLAQSTAYFVPDQIRKKFADGWTTHVPLTYLTDMHCGQSGAASRTVHGTLSFDRESGLISIIASTEELAIIGELNLSFEEWHQAWIRLLSLIREFIPTEYSCWDFHFARIRDSPTRAVYWDVWLNYDMEIRRQATYSGVDPMVFHLSLWKQLEARSKWT